MSTQPITFIVQNITIPPGRVIKVFNTQVYPGATIDVMKIPGITEEMVRYSLLSGDLGNKINNRQLGVITSPITITNNMSNDILNILGPGNNVRPLPIVPGITKALTNNVAASLFQIDMSQTFDPPDTTPDFSFSGKLFFSIECENSTDAQVRLGDINIAAVYKNGVITAATVPTSTNTSVVTSGGLSESFTWVTTSPPIATLQVTPSSSFGSSAIYEIHYFLLHATHRAPAFTFL